MLTRRHFVVSASAAAAAAGLMPAAAFARVRQDDGLEVSELREGYWAIIGGGGNSLLVRTGEGSILIDTKMPPSEDELLAVCTKLTGTAPGLVINTHHHGDHTGGNHAFSGTAEILAHANVKPRLQENLDNWVGRRMGQQMRQLREAGKVEEAKKIAERMENLSVDQFDADEEFDKDRTLKRGDVTLELRHVVPGHTDNDAVIFFPDVNMIHMGDLFFHGRHPYMDTSAKSNSVGWQKSVRAAMEFCDGRTIVIPGHGAVTDRKGLQTQIDYFDRGREAVTKAIKAGATREAIARIEVPEYADLTGNRGSTNLQIIYDELQAEG